MDVVPMTQKDHQYLSTHLHDEKVGIINIETNGTEKILHASIVCIDSID